MRQEENDTNRSSSEGLDRRVVLILSITILLVSVSLGSISDISQYVPKASISFDEFAAVVASPTSSLTDSDATDDEDGEERKEDNNNDCNEGENTPECRAKQQARVVDAAEDDEDVDTTTASNDEISSDDEQSTTEPLNIVLLYADDWRHDSIGSENPLVYTPFLDKLAQKGIKFTHSCVTTSVCWISRANLYTGQYTSRHNTTKMRFPYWYDHWNDSLPALLKENNYYMGHVGKWHFANFGKVKHSWDYATVYYGNHWERVASPNRRKNQRAERIHVTERNQRDALEFLKQRPTNQSFFLSVCFFAPHCVDGKSEQYFPQNYSEQYYHDTVIPVPVSGTDEAWKKMPHFFGDRNEGRRRWRHRFDTSEKRQEMMKKYYRLITEVDRTCERIYEELERQGVLNNTLVIFTTDNGLYHSEHGLAGKWYPHQESIRVPLIVLDPRIKPQMAGTTNDDFVLSIDLAPTILRAAQIEPHPSMQGRDLSKLYLSSSPQDWRQEFFYEHPTHISKYTIPASTALVRKDYKYVRWPDFELEQLFHLEKDPYELNDLLRQESNETTAFDQELLESLRQRHMELAQAAK